MFHNQLWGIALTVACASEPGADTPHGRLQATNRVPTSSGSSPGFTDLLSGVVGRLVPVVRTCSAVSSPKAIWPFMWWALPPALPHLNVVISAQPAWLSG